MEQKPSRKLRRNTQVSLFHLLPYAVISILVACGLATTRPKLEMSLAQAAYLAARKANAQTLAPNLFREAEVNYLKAKSAYRKKFFNKAKQYAERTQKIAERAEFIAVRKKALENL